MYLIFLSIILPLTLLASLPKKYLLEAQVQSEDYLYDVGGKDQLYHNNEGYFNFKTVKINLLEPITSAHAYARFEFIDQKKNQVIVERVNILELIPKLDFLDERQWAEYILEEYERIGFIFRREHNEFQVKLRKGATKAEELAAKRIYRINITNNCLDPGKWEMILSSENNKNFSRQLASKVNYNQSSILAHSWFQLPEEFYDKLFRTINPHLLVDLKKNYDQISEKAETVKINLHEIIKRKKKLKIELLELGQNTNRELKPLDVEQAYKKNFKLVRSPASVKTFKTVTKLPTKLAKFQEAGFYRSKNPEEFDFSWLENLRQVELYSLDDKESDTVVSVELGGQKSPYEIVLGRLDLALVGEQRFWQLPFGYNPYPKVRRYNEPSSNLWFSPRKFPAEKRPFLFMLDKKEQTWVNNQANGIEKIQLAWESAEKNILEIYLISYERITPLWMARVKLDASLVDRLRVKRKLRN